MYALAHSARRGLAALALVAAGASPALARPPAVYLNDVKIETNGLRAQRFGSCEVSFDDNGDVRIVARGFKITAMEAPPLPSASTTAATAAPTPPPDALGGAPTAAASTSPAPASAPTPSGSAAAAMPAVPTPAQAAAGKHYYITAIQPRQGYAQWDVDVYINQTFVKRFRSKEAEPLFEVTKFLHAGSNTVHFTAKKVVEGERLSTSPQDYLELVLGDGELRGGQVMLNKLADFKRDASEAGPVVSAEAGLTVAGP